MKLARLKAGTQTVLASVKGEGATPLTLDTGESWVDPLRVWLDGDRDTNSSSVIAMSETDVLAPVRAPQKIIGVGLNYKDHAAEQGKSLPASPMLFNKSPGAIVGPEQDIVFSKSDSIQVDYEAELAVVIGKRARRVATVDAMSYVLGFTACNDVTARDAQNADGQFFRAKSFDTFCPIGPWIVTVDEIPDPTSMAVRCRVNGEVRQDGNTSNMIFPVDYVVSYASRFMALEPGDVICTGTPAGVGHGRNPPAYLADGDVVEVEVEGVGILRNTAHTRD